MINEIKGNNIILREQKIEDVKFFTYWYNQPLVMFQCGFTKLTDEEACECRVYGGGLKKIEPKELSYVKCPRLAELLA